MEANRPGSRLIKNAVVTLFNTVFLMITSWIISIWVARQLGPSNFGIFNLVLWLVGTITWVVGMGFIHATTKFIAEYHSKGEQQNLRPIIMYILKLELAISVACTIIMLVFHTRIASYFFTPEQGFFFFLAALGLVPGIMTAIFSAAIEGIQKFEYFVWSNLILSPLSFAAKVYVLYTGRGITGLLVVMLVFSFINAIFYFVVLAREQVFKGGTKGLAKDIRARIHGYNRSLIAILACDKIVWDKSENFFLGRFCTSVQIGYYNLGYNVVQRIVSMLPAMFWRVLFPAMSGYSGSGERDKMKRLFYLSTRYLAFIGFPLGVAGMILAYQIINILYGHDYIGAQRSLQILFVASIFSTLANPASAVLYGYEKQAFIYKFGAVLAVFNIILDMLLIKPYGATGAAICYGVTTFIASTGGLFYTCRLMKLRYPFASVAKIAFSTIIMGIVMEIIILQNAELLGFICSLVAGAVVYLICSFVLGTFESEDFTLLNSTRNVLPGPAKVWLDWLISFMAEFKNTGNEDSEQQKQS
ncbi:MAG: flippase [Chitinispirillaceae bacterium]|jgi:O-antigen/teichoic acid export membrane protein|nr:flippase [Chitinispirillaceae bacterium]